MANKKYTDLKMIKAIFLMALPLILILVEGGIRKSISDYEYSPTAHDAFKMLLTIAGMLFFDDGYVFRERYYNMIIGIALIGVALTPHKDYFILHYTFASIFFLGQIFAIVFYSSKKQRKLKVYMSSAIVLGLLGHFLLDLYSLFWAEWIGMLPISLNYIGETIGKFD